MKAMPQTTKLQRNLIITLKVLQGHSLQRQANVHSISSEAARTIVYRTLKRAINGTSVRLGTIPQLREASDTLTPLVTALGNQQ